MQGCCVFFRTNPGCKTLELYGHLLLILQTISLRQANCDNTPPPPMYQLLRNHFNLGWWSSRGSDRGISHFFMATRNTIKRVGGKNKEQTNNMLGLTQVQEVKLWHSTFLCICRLTLTCILREISTKLEECWLILTGLPSLLLDSLSCRLVTSAVRCRLATRVTLR